MDYDSLINSTYKWIYLKKNIAFLLFFWIAVPTMSFIQNGIITSMFAASKMWIVESIYIILIFGIVVGLLALLYAVLSHRKMFVFDISITRFVDTIFLCALKAWYVFVWNLHKSYRFTQLLLLAGTPLLFIYSIYSQSIFIKASLVVFTLLYSAMVLYNIIRTSFAVMIFYNKDLSIKESIKESWRMTHRRFWHTFFAYIMIIASVFVVFAVIAIIIGAIGNLILLTYYTQRIAYQIATSFAMFIALAPALIGYYFGATELYLQLLREHHSQKRVKRILARRVLYPKIAKKEVLVKRKFKKVKARIAEEKKKLKKKK